MLSLALTMLSTQGVVLHPANYGLEGRDESRLVYGARLTKHHANAIGEGMLLAQAAEPPPIPPPAGEVALPLPARSLQDLRAEYQRLEDSRPGLGGSIAMLAIGVACLAVGIPVFFYFGVFELIYNFNSLMWVFGLPVGFILIAAGIVLTIVGGVGLGRKARERSTIGQQMEDIKRQIEALESAPPPPPPPSSVERNGHWPYPGNVVATW
jgi:hypothetical protein